MGRWGGGALERGGVGEGGVGGGGQGAKYNTRKLCNFQELFVVSFKNNAQ